jgi:hypothetical protein
VSDGVKNGAGSRDARVRKRLSHRLDLSVTTCHNLHSIAPCPCASAEPSLAPAASVGGLARDRDHKLLAGGQG